MLQQTISKGAKLVNTTQLSSTSTYDSSTTTATTSTTGATTSITTNEMEDL